MSKTFRIAAIAGDGIGQEVLPEGLRAGIPCRISRHLQPQAKLLAANLMERQDRSLPGCRR